MFWTPWRITVQDRLERLSDALKRLPDSAQNTVDYSIVESCIDDARAAAGLLPSGTMENPEKKKLGGWLFSVNGADVERSWSSIHRAEEALLMIAADDVVRSEIINMQAALAYWPVSDVRVPVYQRQLTAITNSAEPITAGQRESLRAIRQAIDERSDASHSSVRSFRNILLGISAVLAVVLLILSIAQAKSSSIFSLCPAASTTSGVITSNASCRGVGEVELVAGVGALLSAVLFLGALQGFRGPYGLPIAQAILKVVTGAATGLIGVFLVQHAVLDILAPQDSDRVLGYAALFGFAQQAVTQAADTKAAALVGVTSGSRGTSESTHTRKGGAS